MKITKKRVARATTKQSNTPELGYILERLNNLAYDEQPSEPGGYGEYIAHHSNDGITSMLTIHRYQNQQVQMANYCVHFTERGSVGDIPIDELCLKRLDTFVIPADETIEHTKKLQLFYPGSPEYQFEVSKEIVYSLPDETIARIEHALGNWQKVKIDA